MAYAVALTKDAERDLEDIYRYIAEHDSRASADHVLERLLQATDSLGSSRDRDCPPKELLSLGISEYRQVFSKPYRLLYRVHARQAVIYVIADSRGDMQSLLARRLLRGWRPNGSEGTKRFFRTTTCLWPDLMAESWAC